MSDNTPAKADPPLTPESAAQLVLADQANLSRKVRAGQPLTGPERQLVMKIADGKSTADSSALGWAKTKVDLASALGVTRKSLDRWFGDQGHPSARSDGRYSVSEWRAWAESQGKKLGDPAPNQTSLKARQILLQNQLIQDKISVNRRELVSVRDVEQVGAQLGHALRKVITNLHKLGPSLVGRELPEIHAILKDKEDEIISQLHIMAAAIDQLKVQVVPATQEDFDGGK